MPSVKIISPDHIYKDGTRAVMILAIINRIPKTRTLFHIDPSDWDDRQRQVKWRHPNAVEYNQLIIDVINAAKDYLLKCQSKQIQPEFDRLLHGDKFRFDIISRLTVKRDQAKNFRTKRKWSTMIDRITDAGLNQPISSASIDWVRAFDDYLISKNNNPNTRAKYCEMVSAIFSDAVKAKEIDTNPFTGYSIPAVKSKKAKLRPDEFERIRTVSLSPDLHIVRQSFVFAVLARGMRSFDVLTLQWSNISAGRLRYTADKSIFGKPGKDFDIKITPGMQDILDSLDRTGEYIFPFVRLPKSVYTDRPVEYKMHVESEQAMHREKLQIIAGLAGVGKHVTMHVARHTFAFLMGKAGKDIVTIQHTLGHSNPAVTIQYMADLMSSDELDREVDGVFD